MKKCKHEREQGQPNKHSRFTVIQKKAFASRRVELVVTCSNLSNSTPLPFFFLTVYFLILKCEGTISNTVI